MDYAALLAKLNIRLGDSDNFTYTPEEKEDALTEAFNDDHVLVQVWDSSLTYTTGTYQYALPSSVDVVQDVYIKNNNTTDEPGKIDSNLWEVVSSNLHFKPGSQTIPSGWTIYLKGYTKLTEDDTVNDKSLQEYILNLAQLKLLRMLGVKKSLRFLKNDTTLSETIAMRRELEGEVRGYQRSLPRAWEAA